MNRAWMLVPALYAFAAAPAAAAVPTLDAVHSDLSMDWLVAPQRMAGACGDDLFAIEDTRSGARRLCLRRSAATGALSVRSSTIIDGDGWFRILRRPTAADPGFILSATPRVLRHDVASGATVELARFEGLNGASDLWRWFDREGDGTGDIVFQVLGGVEVRSAATGQVVASASGAPWTASILNMAAGQFDADAAGEIAVWSPTGITLYDGLTLQAQGAPIPTGLRYAGGFLLVEDWDADGRDEVLYHATDGVAVVDFDQATPVRRLETGGQTPPLSTALVDWTPGGLPEVAVLASDRAAIVALDSGAPVAFASLTSELAPAGLFSGSPGFVRESTGSPVLLWLAQSLMVSWSAGQPVREVQEGVAGLPMVSAPASSAGGDRGLLHGVRRLANGTASLGLVRRDADTLVGLSDVVLDTSFTDGMAAVVARPGVGRDVLTVGGAMLRLHDVSGATLWTRILPFETGDQWNLAAGASGQCTHPACNRILVEQRAQTTASAGSRLVLINGVDGSTAWEGPRDNCLGCGYVAIALGDAAGDGAPEMLSANRVSASGTAVVLRDATSFAVLWERAFAVFTGPIDVGIAGSGGREVALLTADNVDGTRVHRIDPTTGATIVAVQVPSTVTRLRYLAYGADRGGWLLLGDDRAVWLLDADLQSAPARIDVAEIETATSTEYGVAFLASRHTIHRLVVDGERLLVDGFEPASP